MTSTLKYSVLDDLELALSAGSAVRQPGTRLVARHLGPLIQADQSVSRNMLRDIVTSEPGEMAEALEFLDSPHGLYISASKRLGLISLYEEKHDVTELMQYALLALRNSSLPKDAASQAVSALGELSSNIREHSSRVQSGLLGYEVNDKFVGIYASDAGQGALRSLKRNPAYAHLDDDGEALSLAIKEGVSSTGQAGRGAGFRPLFVGLANHAGLLRFRSGQSLLEINGIGGTPIHAIKERASIDGFHVAVHCTFAPLR